MRQPNSRCLKGTRPAHDKRARDAILEKYLYIAEIIAKKFVGRGVEYDDLSNQAPQVASLALIKAVERFEPERGVKFASFCNPYAGGRNQELLPRQDAHDPHIPPRQRDDPAPRRSA